MSKERVVVNSEEGLRAFAEEQKMTEWLTMVLEFETFTKIYELPVEYQIATAYEIMQIYDGVTDTMSVDEQFDYFVDLLNRKTRGWTWTNKQHGKANIMEHELSVRDLTIESKNKLERAISPGLGKSQSDIDRELKKSRGKIIKGMRRSTEDMARPVSP